MAHDTRETWIHSSAARDALESLSRQERDHDARRRVWLAEDVRRQVAAEQGSISVPSVALAELFPSWFGGIDPSIGQEGTTEHGPPTGDTPGNDFGVAPDSVDPPNAIRSADIRRPSEPRQRFMKVDSSWIDESRAFNQEDRLEGLATRELLGGQTGAGDEFEETWGIGPRRIDSGEDGGRDAGEFPRANRVAPELINRRSNRAVTGREASVELMMSQPFARTNPWAHGQSTRRSQACPRRRTQWILDRRRPSRARLSGGSVTRTVNSVRWPTRRRPAWPSR